MYTYFRKKLGVLRSGEPNPGTFNAHSPYHQFISDLDRKRSRLFPDRRKVPGRKIKFALAIAFLAHFYCTSKVYQAKKQWKIKDQMMRQLHRKISPYFEAIEDIEYATLKNRNDLILGEIFEEKGGMDYVKKWKRFNNQIIWSQSDQSTRWVLAGTGRSEKTLTQTAFGRTIAGLNDHNA